MERLIQHFPRYLIISLAVLTLLVGCKKEQPASTGQPVGVITSPFRPVDVRLEVTGTISSKYLPTIKARTTSKVNTILVAQGDIITKDQPLMLLDNSYEGYKLKEAEAEYNSNLASYDAVKKEYDIKAKLVKTGIISKLTFIEAEGQLKVAQSKLQSAKQSLNTAQHFYDDATIRAPINGRVATIDVSVGSHVQPGDKLMTIVNNNQVTAVFPLSQNRIKAIYKGQTVDLSSDPAKQYEVAATITNIEPSVDQESGLFDVLVTFSNVQNWRVGSSIYGNIILETVPKALVLPDSAVILRGNGYVIYALDKNIAYEVPVTIVMRHQNLIAVVANIKPDLDIVVQGASYLHNGSKVTIQSKEKFVDPTLNTQGA